MSKSNNTKTSNSSTPQHLPVSPLELYGVTENTVSPQNTLVCSPWEILSSSVYDKTKPHATSDDRPEPNTLETPSNYLESTMERMSKKAMEFSKRKINDSPTTTRPSSPESDPELSAPESLDPPPIKNPRKRKRDEAFHPTIFELIAEDEPEDKYELIFVADDIERPPEDTFADLVEKTANIMNCTKDALMSLDMEIKRNRENPLVSSILVARKEKLISVMRTALQFINKKGRSDCIDG